MARVMVNGREVHVPEVVSGEFLREAGDIPGNKTLMVRQGGDHAVVPRGKPIQVHDGDYFFDAPSRTKGAGVMEMLKRVVLGSETGRTMGTSEGPHPPLMLQDRRRRIENEVFFIAPDFPCGLWFDERDSDWLLIPDYQLPARWNSERCNLLVFLPSSYPQTPPVGFYLDRVLPLKGGSVDSHFVGYGAHGAPDLQQQGWLWYCAYVNSWKPSADYTKPDNLLSFVGVVRDVLSSDS